MKYRMPTRVGDLYDELELDLWQSGAITGLVIGFVAGVVVSGLLISLLLIFTS
jgi:hypothetical protein